MAKAPARRVRLSRFLLLAGCITACNGADDASVLTLPQRTAGDRGSKGVSNTKPSGPIIDGSLRGRLASSPGVAWGPLPSPARGSTAPPEDGETRESDSDAGAGDGASTGDGAGTGDGDAGGSGTVPESSAVGQRCQQDADCGDGLDCLTPDSDPFGLGGGPPGGYCTRACEAAQGCPLPGEVCIGGHCLAGCTIGDEGACAGRHDVACTPLGTGSAGYCRPQCRSDADCGERVCSSGRGLCIDPPPCQSDADCGDGVCDLGTRACIAAPPIPVGGACVEDGDCAENVCWSSAELGPQRSCSGFCELLTSRGCEKYGSNAFCLLPVDDTHGYCLALCDVPEDCPQAGFQCLAVGIINGRSGACVPAPPP